MNSLPNIDDENVSYFYAYDHNGNMVKASDFITGPRPKFLSCPACDGPLGLRNGTIRRPHFFHLDREKEGCSLERYRHFHATNMAAEMFTDLIAACAKVNIVEEIQEVCTRFVSVIGSPCVNQRKIVWNLVENLSRITIEPTVLKWAPMLFLEYRDGSRIYVEIDINANANHKFQGSKVLLDLRKLGMKGVVPANLKGQTIVANQDVSCRCETRSINGFILYKTGETWAGEKTYPQWLEIINSAYVDAFLIKDPPAGVSDLVGYYTQDPELKRRLPRSCQFCGFRGSENGELICLRSGEVIAPGAERLEAGRCSDFTVNTVFQPGFIMHSTGRFYAGVKSIQEWAEASKRHTMVFMDVRSELNVGLTNDWSTYFLAAKNIREKVGRSCLTCCNKALIRGDIQCLADGVTISVEDAKVVGQNCEKYGKRLR